MLWNLSRGLSEKEKCNHWANTLYEEKGCDVLINGTFVIVFYVIFVTRAILEVAMIVFLWTQEKFGFSLNDHKKSKPTKNLVIKHRGR